MLRRRSIIAVLLSVVAAAACSRREAPQTPHFPAAPVIVVSIDTLRADHLPAYGYRNVDTPNLDRFRRDAILFENAYAHVPLTLPSHVSMLTGELPPDHGVRNNIGYAFDAAHQPTIPSLLHSHGYATGAAVSAYVLRGGTGLRGAFDFYDDAVEANPGEAQGEVQRPGGITEAIAARWIEQHAAQPFFFLLHIYEPHAPYVPPEPYRSRFASPYDGEIATADGIVGRFFDELKAKQIYDRAIIIVMSDHGEGLSQHGEAEHGIFLYREDLHVPLMLKLPGGIRANQTVRAPAGLIDVFPTIASLLNVEPPSLPGRSLLDLEKQPARSLYAESLYPRIHLGWSELRSLINDRYQFIKAPRPELYDLGDDAAERTNLVASQRRVYSAMRQELDRYGNEFNAPGRIDPEEAKKLAALGYLGSAAPATGAPRIDPKDGIDQLVAISRADALAREGHADAAISAYTALLQKNPRFTDAWNHLGDTMERAGRYEDAAAAYRKAIEITPELAGELTLRLATVLMRLGRFDDAQRHAQYAEKTNLASAKLLEAKIAIARGDVVAGAREATAARSDASTEPAAIVLLARIAEQQNRLEDAAALIGEVDRLRAERHLARVEELDLVRGGLLARLGRYEEAVAAFTSEIRDFPGDKQAYAELALVHAAAGQHGKARAALQSMLKANPGPATMAMAARTAQVIGESDLAHQWRRNVNR
jgi:choline-sulfatase